MSKRAFGALPDHELLEALKSTLARDRSTTVELLVLLGEVEHRRLHRGAGYDSMFDYCLGEHHMSEDVACHRLRVARAVRRWPVILDMIEDGRLHVTGVSEIARYLTPRNAAELIGASVHQSRRAIRLMIAERFPRGDAPTVLRPVGDAAGPASSPLPPTEHPAFGAPSGSAVAPGSNPPVPVRVGPIESPNPCESKEPLPKYPRIEPLAPQRFALQVTIDQECHDLLLYAKALLGHAVPSGDLPEVLKRCLRDAVEGLERRKFGVGARLRTVRDPKDPRYVSPAVRREVFVRDEGQCTFVGNRGHRCGSQTRLQLHHRNTFARGGPATAANLTLHCATHDQLQAERDYGEGFIQAKVEAARVNRGARRSARARRPSADGESATLTAARDARSRGKSPAEVLGSRAAAEAQARLDELLAESA